MKVISLAIAFLVLPHIPLSAQWQNAVTSPPVIDNTPIPSISGTLASVIPTDSIEGEYITLQVAPHEYMVYQLAKVVVVVAANGQVIAPAAATPGGAVTLHFLRDGNELIVDRIFLQ